MSPKSYRRGYPVAVLIGIEKNHAAFWLVFSQVAKHQQNIALNGDRNDPKALYNFHETIINALRPIFKEGIKSIIIASPTKTSYSQQFLNHIKGHHNWLQQGTSKAVFSPITGSASTPTQVAALTQTSIFKQLISDTTAEETENLLEILEKRLNTNATNNLVLYSLQEAEHFILQPQGEGKTKPDYLMLTDEYLLKSRQKYRVQRLMQIAANIGVKTRVISAESTAGKRLTQLGGLVCLAKE
jgi:stalled ribosome rescue protein Dom34